MNVKCKIQMIIVLFVFAGILSACQLNKNVQKQTQTPAATAQKAVESKKFNGVLKEIDSSGMVMKLFNLYTEKEIVCTYTRGTSFKSKNDQELAASQLQIGEVYDVYSTDNSGSISKLKVSSDAWEYADADRFTIDRTNNILKLSSSNYQIDKNLVVSSTGQLINLMDINNSDEITIKGIGGKAVSIIVVKGHGFIRPTNYKDFIGGTISVGSGIMIPVTDNMIVVAREGTYNVTLRNGDLVGTKNIVVSKNQETELDMSGFKVKPKSVGQVNFKISPEGADLYVNGALTDYSKPVSLNYGQHSVKVVCEGYSDYSGNLDVQTANSTININLEDEVAEVTDSSSTDSSSSSIESSDSSDTSSATVTYDKDHVININQPTGAEIYLNGAYKGTVPCSFTKQIGSLTVQLRKSGCVTKSYSVDIIDDDQDISWNFPELAASE